MAGRRKNDRAPNRIGRIRYGSAGKIESVACYLQTLHINWRLNFVIQPLLCTLNRLCRFSSNLVVSKMFTTVVTLHRGCNTTF